MMLVVMLVVVLIVVLFLSIDLSKRLPGMMVCLSFMMLCIFVPTFLLSLNCFGSVMLRFVRVAVIHCIMLILVMMLVVVMFIVMLMVVLLIGLHKRLLIGMMICL